MADPAPRTLAPDWPAPPAVRAFTTLRDGGVSRGAHGRAGGEAGGWNLGAHCGDAPADVARNRARLRGLLPAEPCWLAQVHGTDVLRVRGPADPASWAPPAADAAATDVPGAVLAVLTADCVPVLFADARGRAIAVAHAGWRGLAAGVLERTVETMRSMLPSDAELLAWLGPAIGPRRFEVGDDVFDAFVGADAGAAAAFAPAQRPGKHFADLFALARRRLARVGVGDVRGGAWCTATDETRFYSHRRDRSTGRMATLIWIERR